MDRNWNISRAAAGIVALVALCSMLLGVTSMVAPSADAQGVTYARDVIAPASPTCEFAGTVTDAADNSVLGDYCRPVGFTPLTTLVECEAVAAFFDVQYGFSPSASRCVVQVYEPIALECEAPSVVIPGDMVLTIAGGTSSMNDAVDFVGCGLIILSDASPVSPTPVPEPTVEPTPEPTVEPESGSTSFISQTAATVACIDSPEVQDDPAAANMGLGETFVSATGNRFSITTGGPTCTFDGSGCDASLNLDRVSDVKACLAAIAAASAEPVVEAPAEPATTVAEAPPLSSADEELAYTGEEHERGAAFAGALVGTGLSVLAATRLVVRRRNGQARTQHERR